MAISIADFTPVEIADAQRDLNTQPSFSPYWDTRSGQDTLEVIRVCGLVAQTTESHRRQQFSKAMREAREEVYGRD